MPVYVALRFVREAGKAWSVERADEGSNCERACEVESGLLVPPEERSWLARVRKVLYEASSIVVRFVVVVVVVVEKCWVKVERVKGVGDRSM